MSNQTITLHTIIWEAVINSPSTNTRRIIMPYKLMWKTQSSNAAQCEMHENIESAVVEFKSALEGLYAHNGGLVAILEEEYWETGAQALVKWEEHISGGFGSGTAWIDVNPAENLGIECENEGCCWHEEDSPEMCEECEREGLYRVLDYLVYTYNDNDK